MRELNEFSTNANETKPENTMTVLLVEPGKEAGITTIGTDLASMQKAVGGYIETAYFFDDPVAVVVNEEGKINGLPLNRAVRDSDGEIADIIAGTFFVCGLGEENFVSLPQQYRQKYEQLFKTPETFVRMGKRIVPVPMKPAQPRKEHKEPKLER